MTRESSGHYIQWGYWFGGALCVMSLLSLSLGLIPLVSSIRNKPSLVQLPGQQEIHLRLPGTYVAILNPQSYGRDESKKIFELETFLSDNSETDFFEIEKFPPRRFVQEKEDARIPLFQFIIEEKGNYILSSDYPIGVEGPQISVILFHVDVVYVRTELIVGFLVFLIFGILGIYLIRKTYRIKNSAPI